MAITMSPTFEELRPHTLCEVCCDKISKNVLLINRTMTAELFAKLLRSKTWRIERGDVSVCDECVPYVRENSE